MTPAWSIVSSVNIRENTVNNCQHKINTALPLITFIIEGKHTSPGLRYRHLLLTLEGWIKYLDIQEFFFVSNVICLSISFLLNLVGSGLLCKARLDGWILMLCATSLGVCKIITRYNKINLDICHHKSCSVLWTMDVDERNFMTPGSWYGTIKCKYTQC